MNKEPRRPISEAEEMNFCNCITKPLEPEGGWPKNSVIRIWGDGENVMDRVHVEFDGTIEGAFEVARANLTTPPAAVAMNTRADKSPILVTNAEGEPVAQITLDTNFIGRFGPHPKNLEEFMANMIPMILGRQVNVGVTVIDLRGKDTPEPAEARQTAARRANPLDEMN